jgi:putative redox protein
MSKPPVVGTLTWQGDLRFDAAIGDRHIPLDGHSHAGVSPPEAVALALAGCMGIDVADIVVKGRHDLKALEIRITGERREESPRYFVRFTIHFQVIGDVPAHAVERAIQLSHDKYCSVWHSLRSDIALTTTFEVAPA